MNYQEIDTMILNQVRALSGQQKDIAIDYLENLPKIKQSQKSHRLKVLEQIKEALQSV